jgi:hypothetical protein
MTERPADVIAATNGLLSEPATAPEAEAESADHVDLRLPRAEAEALLLAIDALQPLFDQLRAEVAPEPEPEPLPPAEVAIVAAEQEDHLARATRLARESLQEAKFAIGQRGLSGEQRRAWQEAARRYVAATKRSVTTPRRSGRR